MPRKQWTQKTTRMYRKVPVAERFFSKVSVAGPDECWLWKASTRKARLGFIYGQFSFNGYPEWAHRASYIIAYGEIPEGLQVLHRCDVPLCVNPRHLFIGTQADNMQDMLIKGRDAIVGIKNHGAKLTPDKVILARRMREEGWSFAAIARVLEVGRQTVCDAISRTTWAHIT